MFRLLLRGSLVMGLLIGFFTVILVTVARSAQRPLPPVFYSKNRALYVAQTACPSLLEPCPTREQNLMGSLMYSIPVMVPSPDGNMIAVHLTSGWGIYALDCLLKSPDCEPIMLDPSSNEVRAAWGPDGSIIALGASSDNQINLFSRGCWDPSPSSSCFRRSVTITTHNNLEQQDWSADGSTMVFVDHAPLGLVVMDIRCLDNPPDCMIDQQTFRLSSLMPQWPSVSPDGKRLLYVVDTSGHGNQEALFMLDVQTGESRQLTFGSRVSVYPDWSKDGRYIIFDGYQAPHSIDLKLYILDLERNLTVLFLHQPGKNLNIPAWGAAP